MTSWWLNQPIWKILVKNGNLPPNRGENLKKMKPPPRWGCCFFIQKDTIQENFRWSPKVRHQWTIRIPSDTGSFQNPCCWMKPWKSSRPWNPWNKIVPWNCWWYALCSKTLTTDLMVRSILLFGLFSRAMAMLVSGRVNVAKNVGVECDSSMGQYDGIHIRPKSGRKPKLHSAKFVKPSRIRIEILDMPLIWGGPRNVPHQNKLCAHHWLIHQYVG